MIRFLVLIADLILFVLILAVVLRIYRRGYEDRKKVEKDGISNNTKRRTRG